jgi:hypothetical protein
MRRHALPAIKHFHRGLGIPLVDLAPDQDMGHGVIMPVDLDVVIHVHLGRFLVGELVRHRAQGFKGRMIQRLEGFRAAAGQFF